MSEPAALDLAANTRFDELRHRHYADRQANEDVRWLLVQVERCRAERDALRVATDELLTMADFGGRMNPEFYQRKREAIAAARTALGEVTQ